jgi:hypothetical protein
MIKVLITPEAKAKLDTYIELAKPDEITGFGLAEIIKDGNAVLITDIFIIPQKVSPASADVDPRDIADFLEEFIKEGKDPANIRVWWHSHPFSHHPHYSGIDETTMKTINSNVDWFVYILGGDNGEYNVRVDILKPFKLSLENLGLEIFVPTENMIKELEKEVKEKVKRRPWFLEYRYYLDDPKDFPNQNRRKKWS